METFLERVWRDGGRVRLLWDRNGQLPCGGLPVVVCAGLGPLHRGVRRRIRLRRVLSQGGVNCLSRVQIRKSRARHNVTAIDTTLTTTRTASVQTHKMRRRLLSS